MTHFWVGLAIILPLVGLKVQFTLVLGICIAILITLKPLNQALPNISSREKKASKNFLQFGVAILGLTLPLNKLLDLGVHGMLLTFSSITLIMLFGTVLAKIFKIDKSLAQLINFGTAICGGSAIAALSSITKPKEKYIALSLIIVFVLNAIALFIFPTIGKFFQLSDTQFGIWAALSIHDTSSVVAAASLWSEPALTTATTFKLVRAMWIVPFSFFFLRLLGEKKSNDKASIPKFILFFIAFSILGSLAPSLSQFSGHIKQLANFCIAASLFLIGLSLKLKDFKEVNINTLSHAIFLWVLVSIISFSYVYYYV
ncbi:MAG: putative sulfate exporter family transporter [Halobacteriovoraceae bacterium]|nr:putative sulfate exporter family transporter [Halobacteriovoraceae bacterium]